MEQLLRFKHIRSRVPLGKTALYTHIKAGTFPKGFRIGNGRAVFWRESEVSQWLDEQARNADQTESVPAAK